MMCHAVQDKLTFCETTWKIIIFHLPDILLDGLVVMDNADQKTHVITVAHQWSSI